MTNSDSPSRGGGNHQQCPPPPPSSPMHPSYRGQHQQHYHHEPLPEQRIATLLQFAQSSYETNPTDALSACLDALTISTGNDAAAQRAMHRIRNELGDDVADCAVGSSSTVGGNNANRTSTIQQQHIGSSQGTPQLTEREMTLRAIAVVQELLNDTNTILYSRGKQHILQQAMEDGSSVVCTKCGDMISRERFHQHQQYWCREMQQQDAEVDEEKKSSCDGDDGDMQMG